MDSKCHRNEALLRQDIGQLLKLPDDKLGRLPGILPLCQVMPVFITKNEATNLGIANGSMGRAIGVQFAIDTTFEPVVIHEVQMYISSNITGIVFIDVPRAVFQTPFENLPDHYPRKTVLLYAVTDNTS